jgi:hypothetical protein
LRFGKKNPNQKPPLDQLKAVVKEWPESFKMKDELIRVLEQMLSFQTTDRPTAEQLQLLPFFGRCFPFATKTSECLFILCFYII